MHIGFYCRVFVTLNTILYDEELPEVERLIHSLYRIGVDAIIVQDPAILKLDLPPIALHASTQMHNYDLERIKFLDRLGFQRIVLARDCHWNNYGRFAGSESRAGVFRSRGLVSV